MLNFEFHNDTRIMFGDGQIANITQHIPAGAKVLVTYGGGSIKANGVYDQVMAALQAYQVKEFSGIEPNPKYDTLMKAVEIVKSEQIDFILAVGGGSVVDGSKFIAAAAKFQGEPWDILAKQAAVEKAVPLACVLTLPATGSESNGGSVVTRGTDKLFFGSPLVRPQFAVLDPKVTYSLPTKQVANGVADAFVHVMEQYLTYSVDAKVQDRFAEGLLLTLIEDGPKALQEPENYKVRANVMWAATMALNGLIGAGVPQDWATHMIGHELTAMHNIDHGRTLAIVLPSLMWIKREQKKDKLLQYAERVWNITQGSDEERIKQAVEKTRHFFESLGVPTRMKEYGVTASDIPALVEQLKLHQRLTLGEHGDITLQISEEILNASL